MTITSNAFQPSLAGPGTRRNPPAVRFSPKADTVREGRPRIVLFNVKYSPNLGDGLLSECLERELARSLPGYEVTSVDMAGRCAYPSGRGRGRGRSMALALLERCPQPARRIVAEAALRLLCALRLHRHYRAGLKGARVAVIGGGNLFTDADLNFPVKVAGALCQAARARLPVAIHAVGVAPTLSRRGRQCFARGLGRSRLIWTAVRDPQSHRAWDSHFPAPQAPTARVVIDPGILASLHYPRASRNGMGRHVGLCVTDPLAIRYHGGNHGATRLDRWYPAAVRSLVEQGFEVALFTNGSPEDREYLHARFHDWIRRARGPVTLAPSFDAPSDLAAFVSAQDAIVAHRMHACIAAHSFGVPAVGLRWDIKLDSFFALSGRAAHMLDPDVVAARDLGRRTEAAIADRFDPAPLMARARGEIALLAATLREHAA